MASTHCLCQYHIIMCQYDINMIMCKRSLSILEHVSGSQPIRRVDSDLAEVCNSQFRHVALFVVFLLCSLLFNQALTRAVGLACIALIGWSSLSSSIFGWHSPDEVGIRQMRELSLSADSYYWLYSQHLFVYVKGRILNRTSCPQDINQTVTWNFRFFYVSLTNRQLHIIVGQSQTPACQRSITLKVFCEPWVAQIGFDTAEEF